MANNTYVTGCITFDPDEITKVLQSFVDDKLEGLFSLEFDPDSDYWTISLKSDPSFAQWLQISTYGLDVCDIDCIEIRHRPHDFHWWLDIQVTSALVRALGGEIRDDAVEETWGPNDEKYPTVRSWMKQIYGKFMPTRLMEPEHKELKRFY